MRTLFGKAHLLPLQLRRQQYQHPELSATSTLENPASALLPPCPQRQQQQQHTHLIPPGAA
eukprot:643899-Pelagomonas_calceolata.AAC.2